MANARGIVAPELALSTKDGTPFGRLRVYGLASAEFEAADLHAAIEPDTTGGRLRMISGGAEVLMSESAGAANSALVRCGGSTYEARLRIVRNTAVARRPGDGEAVRVEGGLANRGFEIVFDAADAGSLPVAVFVLCRLVALRGRAFVTGSGGRATRRP